MQAVWDRIKNVVRYIYVGFAWLNLLAVFVIIFVAGMSLFVNRNYWSTHVDFGWGSESILLVLIALGLLGWIPRRLTGWLVAVIVIHAIQTLLPGLKDDLPFISAAHPLNAMVLAGTSLKHAQVASQVLLGNRLKDSVIEAQVRV